MTLLVLVQIIFMLVSWIAFYYLGRSMGYDEGHQDGVLRGDALCMAVRATEKHDHEREVNHLRDLLKECDCQTVSIPAFTVKANGQMKGIRVRTDVPVKVAKK